MAPELTVLTLAALLQAVQFALMAIPANLELGTAKTLSPRDTNRGGGDLMAQASPRTQRLNRAFASMALPCRPHPLHPRLRLRLGALALFHLGGWLPRHPHHADRSAPMTFIFPNKPRGTVRSTGGLAPTPPHQTMRAPAPPKQEIPHVQL